MILLLAGKANHCVCNVQTNQSSVKQLTEQFSTEKLILIKNPVLMAILYDMEKLPQPSEIQSN